MKAVVVEEPEKITLVEREIPQITDDQVLIKVKAAGICGSECRHLSWEKCLCYLSSCRRS